MRSLTLLFVAIICVSGCVTTKRPVPASPEEMSAARMELLKCGRAALPEIDDGVTSAEIVAEALMKICKSEADFLFDTVMRSETSQTRRQEVKQVVSKGRNFIPVVLQHRAKQR